jgi:hypothetical protein
MNRERRHTCRIFGKPKGIPRCRWVDNIIMDLREIGWSGYKLD